MDSSAYFTSDHPLFRRVVGVAPALLLTLRLDMALAGALVYLIYNLFAALSLHWNQKKSSARLTVQILVGAGVIALSELILWFLDPVFWENMAIPLRLMIPSSLVLLSAWDSSKNVNLFTSVQVLFLEGLSLGLAVVLLALFRESLGFGQISFFQFTVAIPFLQENPLKIFQSPGSILILAGILMAWFHWAYDGRKKKVLNPKLKDRRALLEADLAGKAPKSDEEAPDNEPSKRKDKSSAQEPTRSDSNPEGTGKKDPADLEDKPEIFKATEAPSPQFRYKPPTHPGQDTEDKDLQDQILPPGGGEEDFSQDRGTEEEKTSAVLSSRENTNEVDRGTLEQKAEIHIDESNTNSRHAPEVAQSAESSQRGAHIQGDESLPASEKNAFQRPYGYVLQIIQDQAEHPELRILILGSGKGVESYRIAMDLMMTEEARQKPFSIRAVEEQFGFVQMALAAVYPESDWEDLPDSWKARFLLRNKDPQKTLVKLVQPLVDRVEFRHQPIELGDNFEGEPYSLIWLRQPLDILGPGEKKGMYELIRGALLPGHYLLSDFDLDPEEEVHWQALSENLWKKKD